MIDYKVSPGARARPKVAPSGTARAARSLLRRRLAGAKRIEAVLKPEAAAALIELRERTGRTYSAIIVRETTFKDYRGNLNRHLTPWFQGWNLLNIRRADVEDFRAHLLDGGIGPRTVNKCLTLLGALFRYAMRHEWIEANPAEGTKLRTSSRRSHDLVEVNLCPSRDSGASRGHRVTVLDELTPCTSATDEGRAMMEIIHDVAPGASQAFHTAKRRP